MRACSCCLVCSAALLTAASSDSIADCRRSMAVSWPCGKEADPITVSGKALFASSPDINPRTQKTRQPYRLSRVQSCRCQLSIGIGEVYLNRSCILFQVALSWSTPFCPSQATRQFGQHLGTALPTM